MTRVQTDFRLEREMTPIVQRWLSDQPLLIKAEYPTPAGICDLVGVTFCEKAVRHRLSLGQVTAISNVRRLALLLAIPEIETGESAALPDLDHALGLEGTFDARESLGWLIKKGYVVETEPGRFQKRNGWVPLERRIVAVELKLDRPWDALHQTVLRQSFAAEVFVALPLARAKRFLDGDGKEACRDRGVGVLGVSANHCETLLPAGHSPRQHPVLRAQCIERFWPEAVSASLT